MDVNFNIDGYTALGGAIVVQAAIDYLKTKRKLETCTDDIKRKKLEAVLEDIRRFFRSRWYRELTDVDGIYLQESLDNHFEKLKNDNNLKEIDFINSVRP